MEYLYANGIGALIWLYLFYKRRDLQKEMILMSICALPLGLVDLFFVPNYWPPVTLFNLPVGIEGLIFSFEFGGIAAVAYAEVARQVPIRIKHYHRPVAAFLLILTLPLFLLLYQLGIPSRMICLYIVLLTGTGISIFIRKDLLRSAVLGGLVFGGTYFIGLSIWGTMLPEVKDWFTFEGLPKIFTLNAPLYEVILGICFAAYWGNLYELLFGYRFRSTKR